ncbi:unnamed protein product [Vicia faba]|uniref:Uncharacterized protein n=1 Tax=Vicia faba TaxID=3906 RepID=A0AAV0ZI04_VICFA|nr:unnamed protein product [Vicia faba]
MVQHVRTLRQHSEFRFTVNFSKKPSYGRINEEERENQIFKTAYLPTKYHNSSAIVAGGHQRASKYFNIEQRTVMIGASNVPARWFLISGLPPLLLAYFTIQSSDQLLRKFKSSLISGLVAVLFSLLSFNLNSVNRYEYTHIHKEWLKEINYYSSELLR